MRTRRDAMPTTAVEADPKCITAIIRLDIFAGNAIDAVRSRLAPHNVDILASDAINADSRGIVSGGVGEPSLSTADAI